MLILRFMKSSRISRRTGQVRFRHVMSAIIQDEIFHKNYDSESLVVSRNFTTGWISRYTLRPSL